MRTMTMTRRVDQDNPFATEDEKKIDAGIALVRTYNEWQKAMKEYGPFHQKAKDALKEAEKALRKFKRLNPVP